MLSGWAKDAETPILAVQAMGGMGKSALTWSFFNSQIKDGTRHGFDGAMRWSFYEHSAYFSNFLAHLYCYCFQCSLEDARKKSWSDLEEPLLQSLAANRLPGRARRVLNASSTSMWKSPTARTSSKATANLASGKPAKGVATGRCGTEHTESSDR